MQFDYSYLRQYPRTASCSTSSRTSATIIETEPLPQNILDIGVVGGVTTGIPTSTNAWGLYHEPGAARERGVESSKAATGRTTTTGSARCPAEGPAERLGRRRLPGRIQNFELQLRSEDSYLFSEDGEPGFDEERLTEFWESGADIRETASASRSSASKRCSPRAASTPR